MAASLAVPVLARLKEGRVAPRFLAASVAGLSWAGFYAVGEGVVAAPPGTRDALLLVGAPASLAAAYLFHRRE